MTLRHRSIMSGALIPGCSIAGDQDPSGFPVRPRCRVGVRNASSPHRGRDLPCRALGKTDSGGGWLRVQLEQPGVLLLRRLGPGGPRGVAVAMFGHAGLGMLICRCEHHCESGGCVPQSPTCAGRIRRSSPIVRKSFRLLAPGLPTASAHLADSHDGCGLGHRPCTCSAITKYFHTPRGFILLLLCFLPAGGSVRSQPGTQTGARH